MVEVNAATRAFVQLHREEDVRRVALKGCRDPEVDLSVAVEQIAGYQIARRKVPSWASNGAVVYPPHLSLEQCSSEETARFKATLMSGKTLTDLTGGMGVDCYYMAQSFREVHYVERQSHLCELAEHNFRELGGTPIMVHSQTSEDYLKTMKAVDWIYLDPARRDSHGGKTIAVSDCTPDVSALETVLLEKAERVMIKLSPMLDLTQLLHTLHHIETLHVVAVGNECKELLAVLSTGADSAQAHISCVDLSERFATVPPYVFTQLEESETLSTYASRVGTYLYEPLAAIMKAGAFKSVGARFHVEKLHQHSHLYTGDDWVDFPGRRFRVESVFGLGKKELNEQLKSLPKANLSVRNFPSSTEALRKKLKLKEGGEVYLFATTLANEEKVLIRTVQC